jgi:hypothetical protein
MRGNFPIRFLDRLWPATHVVPQFVGSEVVRIEPSAGLETDDAQAGPRKRKCGNTADSAETDNDDVRLRQVRGHGFFFENIAYSYADR